MDTLSNFVSLFPRDALYSSAKLQITAEFLILTFQKFKLKGKIQYSNPNYP